MIIGSIIDVSNNAVGPGTTSTNGAAMLQFQVINDAIIWAESQSQNTPSGTGTQYAICTCTVINTDTGIKRWWFDGIEYTG